MRHANVDKIHLYLFWQNRKRKKKKRIQLNRLEGGKIKGNCSHQKLSWRVLCPTSHLKPNNLRSIYDMTIFATDILDGFISLVMRELSHTFG